MSILTWAGRVVAILGAGIVALSMVPQPSPAAEESTSSPGPFETAKKPQTRPSQTRPAQSRPPSMPESDWTAKPLVFTDDDLKRFHETGSLPPARKAAAPPSGEDPLRKWKDVEERDRWRKTKAAQLQQRILDLESKLKVLEMKRLSIQNPLLPRPQDPESTAQIERGLSGPELLAMAEEEIRQTTRQIEEARRDLAVFLETAPE